MKKYSLLVCLLAVNVSAFSQAEFDALKYSTTDISGTARYVSMSGAFGALGGDMSVLGMNPAGIGVYRTSELSFSPALQLSSANSDFNGSTHSDSKLNALVNNFGYVGSFRTYDESAISNFNFGFSYNRIKDFNRHTSVKGLSRETSLLDMVCANLNGSSHTSNFQDYAEGTNLIYLDSDDNLYKSSVTSKLDNSMEMIEKGGVDEWNFTLGANYGHILYVGMSVGVQSLYYELTTEYYENFKTGETLELGNALITEGSGINFKLGVIYRPIPELRLGIAFHTSTYYKLTDTYAAAMASYGLIDPATNAEYDPDPVVSSDENSWDYQLKTPGKVLLSAAYQIGEKALVSFDCELVDYDNIMLKYTDGSPMSDVNGYINEDFRTVANLRLGTEYRLSDNFSIRAGGAMYESPVKSSVEESNLEIVTAGTTPQYEIYKNTYYASGGVGYHDGGFFLDAALQYQMNRSHFFNFYDSNTLDTAPKYAQLNTNKTNLVLTTGFKF
jgi:long-subunit fatty acid transport protein